MLGTSRAGALGFKDRQEPALAGPRSRLVSLDCGPWGAVKGFEADDVFR